MSEYQYYEFQAVDRPLTQEEMSELRGYSTRADITPSSFVNVYDWGNFKGDPDGGRERYFDAFVYVANWGSHWLMLRVPRNLLDGKKARAYCTGESLSCRQKGDHVIVSFTSEGEDHEFVSGEGWLGAMLPVRADVMQGDLRALYLGWLYAVQTGETDDDEQEPPVPPGLGALNASLVRLAEFLRIDGDLIDASAEGSEDKQDIALSEKAIGTWISTLQSEEKDILIARLIATGSPHLAIELRQRASRELCGEATQPAAPRQTVGQLRARAHALGERRRQEDAERRAVDEARRERERVAIRTRHLESLAGKEETVWARVHQLVSTRQPSRYDEAVSHLEDLHDLAKLQGDTSEFSMRMARLFAQHQRKSSLVDRLRQAGLLG